MLGLGLGLTDAPAMASRSSAFNPATLFTGGIAGAFYDFSDQSGMFQDSAATVPAAVDSPVGYVADKSGNGHHATQVTAEARPMLRSTGGMGIDLDAVNDFLLSPLALSSPMTIMAGVRFNAIANYPRIVDIHNGAASVQLLRDVDTNRWATKDTAYQAGTDASGWSTPAVSTPYVVSAMFSGAATSFWQDGDSQVTGGAPVVGVAGAATNIGRRSDGNALTFFNGRLFALIVVSGQLTAAQRSDTEAWLAAKAGVTL